MIHIARSSAAIDFIKNICYNLYIKQREKYIAEAIVCVILIGALIGGFILLFKN